MLKRGPENPLGEHSPYKKVKIIIKYFISIFIRALTVKNDVFPNTAYSIIFKYNNQKLTNL